MKYLSKKKQEERKTLSCSIYWSNQRDNWLIRSVTVGIQNIKPEENSKKYHKL